jgi:Enoyl-(Acyl carrier protein) reductase
MATSSETGILGSPKLLDYSATKGAINAFTKALAVNLIPRGIRVNAVAPGPVWTPLNPADTGLAPDKVAVFGKDTPMGRPAQPEEIAPAYVFLASPADSSYITGVVLPIMGGETVGGWPCTLFNFGLWDEGRRNLMLDEVIIFEVMVESLNRTWWRQYRNVLEKRFKQKEVLIRALAMEKL